MSGLKEAPSHHFFIIYTHTHVYHPTTSLINQLSLSQLIPNNMCVCVCAQKKLSIARANFVLTKSRLARRDFNVAENAQIGVRIREVLSRDQAKANELI